MITFLALSPSVDVTYLVDSFVEGSMVRPAGVFRVAGGKALNAARSATTIGAPVGAVAVLGGATGSFIRGGLDGISLDVVSAAANTRTCVSVASKSSGLLTEIYEHPAAVSAEELSAVESALSARLAERSGWFAISGGVPASVPLGFLPTLVDLAHSAGHLVAIDSHGPALADALVSRPDLVKVNRSEAAEVLGLPDETDAFELAARVREISGGRVVITDGVRGSFAVAGSDGDRDCRYRAIWSGEFGAYPVGSGDSYLGGLLAALDDADRFARGSSAELPECSNAGFASALALAAGCATANALVPGAGRFAASDARAIAADVAVTRSA